MKPSIGRIVHIIVWEETGWEVRPAQIHHVINETTVNLTVNTDEGPKVMKNVTKSRNEGDLNVWFWPVY